MLKGTNESHLVFLVGNVLIQMIQVAFLAVHLTLNLTVFSVRVLARLQVYQTLPRGAFQSLSNYLKHLQGVKKS